MLINATFSSLEIEAIETFYAMLSDNIRAYFPRQMDYQFIGIVASLDIDESVIDYCNKLGLFIIGRNRLKNIDVDILNPSNFKPHYF